MKLICSCFPFSVFRFPGGVLAVLLLLAFARAALATDSIYQNYSTLYYTLPGNPPPQIDATAFDNESVYSVTYTIYVNNQVEFFEPWWNTRFFTNNGVMIINAPYPTNSINSIFSWPSTGVGFQFDTQAGNSNVMAGTFYNSGSIHCDSFLDGNNNVVFYSIDGFDFLSQTSIGECVVLATNIINPGEMVVSPNGLLKITGTNVDLSRATLTMEGAGANLAGTGDFGLNVNVVTNGNTIYYMIPGWDPSIYLGPASAESALFPMQPITLYLPNSTAYFNFAYPDSSNTIIRSVFIEDTSDTNVAYNVYFDTAGIGFGGGNVTIEWVGSYLDSASGNTFNNYLYLNDNYVLGASTNVALSINGIPDNFTFTASDTRLIFQTPAPPGFYNVFPSGTITNGYAFANAQLISSTVATNASNRNPSGALTNLPGRLQITGGRDLDLRLASITGPNYLSIQSPNQFEGSAGAQIISPYADINVGVTNGFLTVSNLMQPIIPNWSGTVQAWSTRWLVMITNVVGTNIVVTGTNDYRVLIVGSQLTPTTLAYVQDLILHGTNSLVLSDGFYVLRKLSADAQNLTLTTNEPGNGATSLDGELNLFSGVAWSGAFPNLKNLTNNGAIRVANGNPVQFGSGTPVYVTNSIPSMSAVAATGMLSHAGAVNVAITDQVTIGLKQYTFTAAINRHSPANQILVDTTFDGSMSNLIAAINGGAGSGTKYSSATTANTQATAGLLTSHAFTVTAITAGSAGNSIVTTTTSTNLTWNGYTTLTGGVDAVPGATNVVMTSGYCGAFINHGLVSDFGATIYVTNFENDGVFSNASLGSFALHSQTATLTNGSITAGSDVSITADTLLASNVVLHAGRGLMLQATNLLTDGGVTNGNIWSVGATNGTGGNGLALMIRPLAGDLLGTTITNCVPGPNKQVNNTWAGEDRGSSTSGYTNNAAVGRLILDALGPQSIFNFNGAGASNAMYVDYLELRDQATNRDGNGNFTALNINPNNMVIYFAYAVMEGQSVVDKMNHKNGDRLRWVTNYAGHFSSTNVIFPDGTTNTYNIALVQSTTIDSDNDGIANGFDPTPFGTNNPAVPLSSAQMGLTITSTNNPAMASILKWRTIANATNYVLYKTDLTTTNWLPLVNFITPPSGTSSLVTVTYTDPATNSMRTYRVRVDLKQ